MIEGKMAMRAVTMVTTAPISAMVTCVFDSRDDFAIQNAPVLDAGCGVVSTIAV
jgi:hypothetical protein